MAKLEGDVVVDTNIFVKLFFAEEDSDLAELLSQQNIAGTVRFIVPDFVAIEFANVLWLRLRRGGLDLADAQNVLTLFLGLLSDAIVVPSSSPLIQTFQASVECDHAAYDMAFVALAEKLNLPFITADEKLYSKIRLRSKTHVLLRNLEQA